MAALNKGETRAEQVARMRAMSRKALEVNVRHGHSGKNWQSPTYRAWHGMRSRCELPTSRAWRNYGGRGIKVCPQWRDFAAFLADMGERPPATTLDRIDNDGDYEPGNCRWATNREQSRNRRNNCVLTLGGRTAVQADWAKELGISSASLRRRLKFWPLRRALTAPRTHRPGDPARE